MIATAKRAGHLVKEWLPEPETYYTNTAGLKLKGRGTWRVALCAFHDESNPSMSINVSTGGFVCHACGAKGGDVLAFHRARFGLSFPQAARDLSAWEE